ncbi:MAG: CBS and ACT domain-containing protein [Pseudomonadota bacterium]
MQVQNWMTTDVVTVDEGTSIIIVSKILKEHNIRHLPVTRDGKLVGMITNFEIQEAFPSKSTTLNAHELHHLLAETKAKDIMKPDPVTIRPDQTMEVAAVKMLEHKIAGLPVIKENREIVGIISQGDVFRVLISITGIYQGGVQFAFNLDDKGGAIKEVADVMRIWRAHIVSILSTNETADEGYRHTFIRIKKVPEDHLQKMIEELDRKFMLLYVIKDPLKDI